MSHTNSSIVLAFHAEQLHENAVWRRVDRIARWMAVRGMTATFFVYPFRAQAHGKEIAKRVQTLAQLGHEIGQHTHFYAGNNIDKPGKTDDFSAANIVRCLRRDFETLGTIGSPPKGFTAGSWYVNTIVLDTLVKLGFIYDCSARFPKPGGTTHSAFSNRWLSSPQFHSCADAALICLPTTCSLGEWFKWGRNINMKLQLPYRLICLHDYDLLYLRNHLLLWSFLRIVRPRAFTTSLSVAAQYISSEEKQNEFRHSDEI